MRVCYPLFSRGMAPQIRSDSDMSVTWRLEKKISLDVGCRHMERSAHVASTPSTTPLPGGLTRWVPHSEPGRRNSRTNPTSSLALPNSVLTGISWYFNPFYSHRNFSRFFPFFSIDLKLWCSVDQLLHRLIDWLLNCLIACLLDWLMDCLIACLLACLLAWLIFLYEVEWPYDQQIPGAFAGSIWRAALEQGQRGNGHGCGAQETPDSKTL